MKHLLLVLPLLVLLACQGSSGPTELDEAALSGSEPLLSGPLFTPVPKPAQYCKVAAPPEFFNACTVCAAHGSPGPAGDGRICICKTIMSGFFGPPPFSSFGECMKTFK